MCAPLVAHDAPGLLAEAAAVAALGPDLLEWRVDFFEGIARTGEVVELASAIKRAAGGLPLLFTRRSAREGGQPIALDEAAVAALCRAVCAGGGVDLVDYEMDHDPAHVAAVREAARTHGVGLVLSFHDFQGTPPVEALLGRLRQAAALGADVAKLAVMPRDMGDVLNLLSATWQASQSLPIPLISMAMGPLGAVTRLAGGAFGSALSFGAGQAASAPGQMPIAELRQGLTLLQRAMERRA
ncbi:Candidate 3-dehydroquinate dehydratase [Ramlibacter tataouinensis TTB310]|uniref:3-dehydroquinate dehydratase n=1 Tax=Ramlibacter tataouinensis (strain ATCC BAA-407 / DSM 14655 / LMG 21543 / TTB310) TaxID=365046 RepID=F5XZ25_RAMTT|nr:Candidate 3-dehydroquinate dehydratase [Ramlibacter tataouinensis TTB310]